jgi:rhamnopyranosyl-N-acetylglucosaminyl-diphospho-decaprenol beta-1,3/1,4-galactofuranosyltransferase
VKRVIAVVVTYNRRELLLEALAALRGQSRAPDAVLVVDNASDDGTSAAVRTHHPEVRLLEMTRNTGGAGGFAVGVSAALEDGADLIWLMDDDTIPRADALAELLLARERYRDAAPAVVASRVEWTDGRPHPMNTPRTKPFASRAARAAAAPVGCTPIRSASFVSVLLDATVVAQRGLPVADYFLWNDDFEYTARLIRGGVGLLCPRSIVLHKTATFGSTDADPGARFYYEVRNKIWMLLRSTALGPLERVLYGGSTLRRWGRTIRRSPDRAELWRCLRRGVVDGVRTKPRATETVLAELVRT